MGLRANYIASVYAARLMVERGNGIIVNMSSPGGLTRVGNVTEFLSVLVPVFSAFRKFRSVLVPFFSARH